MMTHVPPFCNVFHQFLEIWISYLALKLAKSGFIYLQISIPIYQSCDLAMLFQSGNQVIFETRFPEF